MALLLVWSAAARWPWPDLLPEEYSLRTVRELLFGTASLPALVGSSTLLALVVAVLGTAVGLLTARATELYDIPGKSLVRFGTFLPLLVPGTVFAMGIQITLIRLGLADTAAGVVLVHTIVAMPYCITILTDVTRAVGVKYEEQAAVLGAGPVRAFFQASLPALLPGVLSSMSMGFILSSSQYFTTLMVGGGRVRTLALVLVPYIQSGDRSLSAIYSVAFAGSALAVFFVLEGLLHLLQKRRVIL
ncbi:MAG TPA: ABC transporter permease subunit [Candidatus Flavonifractor intestinipullorum]|uniref:ABC transporter permease subunit n=1 Tax=Candidatus Flavonifractor intestinipullorum TaxID=2838587 RepID=A0A9D2S5N7_9FIRM|nr:ABC transporter permease subunit [Candidatus Flavonifractor intestinipullorum]